MTEPELLFTQVLGCRRDALYLDKNLCLTQDQAYFISSALKRRMAGEPIQYILGATEFMGFNFKLNKHVLIPRPETEILVETVLKYAGSLPCHENRILELGAGSGCVAVSLAKLLPYFKITSTDISREALKIAALNSRLNGVTDNLVFILSDLFNSLPPFKNRYSMCVSNPPYVTSNDIERLQPEIRFEPRVALDGGIDGLNFYRRIIDEASDYLPDQGLLIMEMGFNQRQAIEEIFCKSGRFKIIEVIRDYNSLDRVIVARKG